ncbi:MAG: filamentous hemagglutinin N-terminal domain-containing protein [Methylotenera sp.]|nr:filamentous hemagglutinin N-terminal domain-containing protein [Methylotenera sp.]
MNKTRFRIIFNKARGMLMAVAEHIANAGKSVRTSDASANGHVGQANHTTVTLKPTHFAVLCHLGLVSFVGLSVFANPAHADIIADQTAPANQRPVIINAPNGVPLVNIQTPSAAGVSRNTYSQFDVNANGAILNNSRTNVQTQLGGWVQGNPYLATGTARIILNEVNSNNPSLLNGYVEVAGSRAQVVIANPAGISCNGCGFINASRTTLTTGTPIINNGDLIGYRVGGGAINFLGAGLDTANSNYTDVIARAVNVNAGLWAQNLNIITGSNQVNVASNGDITGITPISPNATLPDGNSNPTPGFAIDVAALGGMYAGKIHMIGTEAGLGVRNAGSIGASVGEVSIDVNGNLTNSNRISSTTQTNINAASISNTGGTITAGQLLNINTNSLTGDGQLLSGGDATVTLSSDYTQTTSGKTQANGNLTFTTTGNLTNQGSLLAGNTLTLNAANIDNTATAEITGLNTQLNVSNTLTNRGVIDGSDTFINANVLNNIGTGSIFGDHIAIAANTLNNTDETVNGINTSAVIAARNRLDIGANTITNQNNALMFSAGDIAIAGALDGQHQATIDSGQTQTAILLNKGATIEALGNLNANINDLQNLNAGITTQTAFVGSTAYDQFTPRGQSVILDAADYPGAQIGNQRISTRTAGPYTFREYWRYVYTGDTTETQVLTSAPAQLLSGNHMILNGNVTNSDSKIIAGGALDTTDATLNNLNTQGQTTTSYNGTAYYYDYDGSGSGFRYDVSASAYNPANLVTSFNLPTSEVSQHTAPVGTGTVVTNINLSTLPNSSLFQPSPDPSSHYLLETNPRFANYRTWLSSDFMLNALRYDPATQTKRLGDGFYEQRLIREQINALTGQRFLVGYADDEAQYQALMSNGATFAQAHQLVPGVALSAEQVAQLTSDIVWLVAQTMTLPDGTQTQALVPQVYVRLQAGDISHTGSLLAGQSIHLNLASDETNNGNLINSGSILGRGLVVINAQNIHNLGGRMQGQQVALTANDDINNIGGTISAQDVLVLDAGRDINVKSTTQSASNQAGQSSFTRTNLDRVAGLYVGVKVDAEQRALDGHALDGYINPTGTGLLVASAGNDIHLDAAALINLAPTGAGNPNTAEAGTYISAANNLNFGTVATAEQNNSIRNTKNYVKHGNTQEIGTNIQTTGDISLTAGNDLNARAVNINSEQGALSATAGNDMTIEAGEATSNVATARYVKKSGTFSSKKTTERNTYNDTTSISSNLSADTIALNAQNIKVDGSNVVATNNLELNATANVNITAATDTHDETHYKKVSKTGFTATSTSIGYGSSKLTNTNDSQQVTNVGSTVGSVEGDVNIISGKTYTQTGSDILTPQGDISITAQQVNIINATDTYANQQSMKYKQTGITLAVSSSALNLAQNVAGTAQAAVKSDSNRNKALNALQTYANASTLQEQGKAIVNAVKAGNVQDAASAAGVRVSVSIGSSKASSTGSTNVTTSQEGLLKAGGDISIKATQESINVVGSEIKAAQNVTLDAAKDINLIASADTEANLSKNKSSSASIGVSFGVGKNTGFSVDVAASRGKGNANSDSTTYNNSQVSAGEKLNLKSGNDANLIGANLSGKQVIANIGGDLNMKSLQDTSASKAKQSNTSVGVSIPIGLGTGGGSFSQSKQKSSSNYASVYEQSGIKAGSEGFNITTQGNTDLKGSTISSEASADKNQLTTGTLTTSNIQNHMDAKASGSTTGLSTDMLSSKYALAKGVAGNLMNNGKESVSDNSATLSAIASAAINITDNTTQLNKTGKTTEETVATLNRDTTNTNRVLAKPDIEALQEKVQQQLADRQLLLATITTFTDESFNKAFLTKAQMYEVMRDDEGKLKLGDDGKPVMRVLDETEKLTLKANGDNKKLNVFTNGIFNDETAAANYSVQMTEAPAGEKVYLVHFPEANNFLSELLIAAYQKNLESSTLGLSNATQEIVNLSQTYGQDGLNLVGHSRGSITIGNALEMLLEMEYNKAPLSDTTVKIVGPAYSAQELANSLNTLSGGNQTSVQLQNHIDDFTGRLLGSNPPTYGTRPAESSMIKEWIHTFGKAPTVHSCYGTGAASSDCYPKYGAPKTIDIPSTNK